MSLQKVLLDNINLDVEIPFLGIYPEETLIHVFQETTVRKFIAEALVTEKHYKLPKCPFQGEFIS